MRLSKLNLGLVFLLGLLLVSACASVTNEPAATATRSITQPATASPESGLELTPSATVSATPSKEPVRTNQSITKTTASPSATDLEAAPRYFASPDYGVQAFLWWDPNIAKRDLEAINTLDFNWVGWLIFVSIRPLKMRASSTPDSRIMSTTCRK